MELVGGGHKTFKHSKSSIVYYKSRKAPLGVGVGRHVAEVYYMDWVQFTDVTINIICCDHH
jgi:hypothetical protein